MNAHDSARIKDLLSPIGYETTEQPNDADFIILNTCHIREKACEKVYSELGRLRAIKSERQADGLSTLIAVAGCVAQAEGREILHRAPFVDIVLGPQTYHRLPEMIAKATRDSGGIIETDFDVEEKFDCLPISRSSECSAYVTIQEGCNKFCTFCVVPYTRGPEFSRPTQDVVAEVRELAANGVCEITLLGQNVNNYHGVADGEDGEWGLARLIRVLSCIRGIERIRYTTSYPADVDDDLIEAHRDIKALMPFLHLPLQSGSNRVLAAMNRRHTADDYRRLVDKLRQARPDLALASDFIVGFPTETSADFRETLRLVKDIGFAQAYSFKFSARPGTPAAAMPQLDDSIKKERLAELQSLLNLQQFQFNKSMLGQIVPVLFSLTGSQRNQVAGRTPYMQSTYVTAPPDVLHRTQMVRITGAGPNSVTGELVDEALT